MIFGCFSVFIMCFVWLRAFTGRLWQCRDVWWGVWEWALYANGWAAKPWKARAMQVMVDIWRQDRKNGLWASVICKSPFDIASKSYVLSNHSSQVRDGPKHSSCRRHKSSEKRNEDSSTERIVSTWVVLSGGRYVYMCPLIHS
jgi:hypothetical protein